MNSDGGGARQKRRWRRKKRTFLQLMTLDSQGPRDPQSLTGIIHAITGNEGSKVRVGRVYASITYVTAMRDRWGGEEYA